MNKKIKEKLDAKKQQIKKKAKDLSMNVPEVPPDNWEKTPSIPGFIEGGPKMSKKWKQV
tara:strand:- start:120 stop:296 length:177 start_codon:yes stop_codon:yes gene_type:complete